MESCTPRNKTTTYGACALSVVPYSYTTFAS